MTTWRSCITATAVAVGALLAGCNSTATSSGTSGPGDSCESTFDCKSGLSCINFACSTGSTSPSPDGGTTPKDGGTTPPGKDGGTTPPTPDSGTPPAKDGGTTPPPSADAGFSTSPSLLGGHCQVTTDCAAGLQCIPSTEAIGGICDLVSFGLKPTGNVCGGECTTAADCYELPVGNPSGVTCQAILANALAGNSKSSCNGVTVGTATSVACFYYTTYCNTASAVWACTNNSCVYTGACSAATTDDVGGCPTETRTGAAPVNGTSCDLTDAAKSTCTAPSATPECKTTADCNSDAGPLAIADHPSQMCAGDCICYKGACYDACASTLDCAAGYQCASVTGGKLCELAPACTTNAECAVLLRDVNAVCGSNGACGIPCDSDHDCSISSGASATIRQYLGNFNGTVCDTTTKLCTPVGCSTNQECPPVAIAGVGDAGAEAGAAAAAVNTLCVPAPAPATTVVVQSAITN